MGDIFLSTVLLDHVRGLGYHVGRTHYNDIRLGGLLMVCLDAVDTLDGFNWIVRAPADQEYAAIIALCKMAGIDLMDGQANRLASFSDSPADRVISEVTRIR